MNLLKRYITRLIGERSLRLADREGGRGRLGFHVSGRRGLLALQCLAFGAMLTACSSEAIDDPKAEEPQGEQYYITLTVATNTEAEVTRATTNPEPDDDLQSSTGTIAGVAAENELRSVTLYFCKSGDIITSFESDYIGKVEPGTNKRIVRIYVNERITELEDIADYWNDDPLEIYVVGNQVIDENGTKLFTPVFGNGYSERDMMAATFSVSSASDKVIGDFKDNNTNGHVMPLVSYKKFTIDVPAPTGSQTALDVVKSMFDRDTATIHWWDLEDNEGNSVIDLERAVARIEYKDKVRTGETNNILKNQHIYQIGEMQVYAKLYSLTPFNINKKAYLFRHTADGDETEAWEWEDLLGFENSSTNQDIYQSEGGYTWISNPDWAHNVYGGYMFDGRSRDFWNALSYNTDKTGFVIGTPGGSDYLTRTVDQIYQNSNGVDDYHPWCYVMENTLYSTELMDDVDEDGELLAAKFATGVRFRLEVMDKTGVNPATPDTPQENLPYEIQKLGNNNIMITEPMSGDYVILAPDNNRYYLEYVACIVHNGKMTLEGFAPMFYGVVRNNTYQMSVTKVERLPNPREPMTMYLQVQVNVLKWDRRESGFDF